MALTINTNMASIQAQNALNSSTNDLNSSIERMTTGYKINSASDDAAGYAVASLMETKLSSVSVAESNVELGVSLLDTIEGNYEVINDHLQRIRDLTEQAANGTYSTSSLKAIESEITQRLDEIDRVTGNVEYNDMYLLDGTLDEGVNLQVGITSSINSVITLDSSLFASTASTSLLGITAGSAPIYNTDDVLVNMTTITDKASFAEAAAGLSDGGTDTANDMLAVIDTAMADISDRTTVLGSVSNRLDSASDSLSVQSENLTSSLSIVRDADIAEESSTYVSAQILQSASSTLLATANQTPSIALNLI